MVYTTDGAGMPVAVALKDKDAEHNPRSLLAVKFAGQLTVGGSCGIIWVLISPPGKFAV